MEEPMHDEKEVLRKLEWLTQNTSELAQYKRAELAEVLSLCRKIFLDGNIHE